MCKQMSGVVVLGMLLVSTAFAQPATYPTKPIRWLIPFAAGGGTDVIARPLVQKLSDRLGQSIIYENRGGAGGVVAGEIVARATPDGYTLLVAAVAVMTVTVSLVDKMPFDPVKDFVPITKFANVPNILVARPGFAPRTLKEIVDYAHANPGKLIWASSGTGSAGMLTMELFRLNNGLQMVHVPYKGAGPATTGVLTNEADLLFANPGVFMGHIKAGRLRPIVSCSSARLSILPEVPTVAEMGFPGYENGSWYGLAAPGTHARPDHPAPARRGRDGTKIPEVIGIHARRRPGRRQHAGSVRAGNPRRHREVGEGHQGGQRKDVTPDRAALFLHANSRSRPSLPGRRDAQAPGTAFAEGGLFRPPQEIHMPSAQLRELLLQSLEHERGGVLIYQTHSSACSIANCARNGRGTSRRPRSTCRSSPKRARCCGSTPTR